MNKSEVIIDTKKHISKVNSNVSGFATVLENRTKFHDLSKLSDMELDFFAKYTPKLAGTTYMSDDYKRYLEEMKPALDHHYGVNSHHPEYYSKGIEDMSLFDIIEMLMDWKAAVERHDDGDIFESLRNNAKRFVISSELMKIFEKTIKMSMPYYFSYKRPGEDTVEIYSDSLHDILKSISEDENISDWENNKIIDEITDYRHKVYSVAKFVVNDSVDLSDSLICEFIRNDPVYGRYGKPSTHRFGSIDKK